MPILGYFLFFFFFFDLIFGLLFRGNTSSGKGNSIVEFYSEAIFDNV